MNYLQITIIGNSTYLGATIVNRPEAHGKLREIRFTGLNPALPKQALLGGLASPADIVILFTEGVEPLMCYGIVKKTRGLTPPQRKQLERPTIVAINPRESATGPRPKSSLLERSGADLVLENDVPITPKIASGLLDGIVHVLCR